MCLGIPGRVVEIVPDSPDLASVDVAGVARRISLALLADDRPQPGDWVLIHLGFALQRMTAEEAADACAVLADLGEGELLEGIVPTNEAPPWAVDDADEPHASDPASPVAAGRIAPTAAGLVR